jgi:hypothetical protein
MLIKTPFNLDVPNKLETRESSWFTLILMMMFFLVSAGTATAQVTSTSLGQHRPTFVGPAATGCHHEGCSLLTGPFPVAAVSPSSSSGKEATSAIAAPIAALANASSQRLPDDGRALPYPRRPGTVGPDPTPPTVSCEPLGPGCDTISSSSGGAIGVKGLNAVDNGKLLSAAGDPHKDNEPSDQGLCAGNGYVVEATNIGQILVFNTALQRQSSVIPLEAIMGLSSRGWSSGGDISCLYDYDNGGHWFFTQFVSPTTEASGGPFSGCFVVGTKAVANSCYEGIAVTEGNDPFGPYNVYFLNANYNPREPGYPYLLNDFAKIATSRDAFLLFYDEFLNNPSVPGFGGGGFNGAQEFAFNKNALELGLSVTRSDGSPNPAFTVAIENMGLFPTPDGGCAASGGATCWYQVIPAQPPDPSQYDNSHGGSGFMLAPLDFLGSGDTRIAVFDWTGLEHLNGLDCSDECEDEGIRFGGQLFSGVEFYFGEGFLAAQKSGPIPLGDQCGAAKLSVPPSPGATPPASCPEGGIATNGDGFTQVSQAQGKLWGAVSTAIAQTFSSEASPEVHQGAAYWVIGTSSFDTSNVFSLTSQGYVSPEHEDLTFPTMAAGGSAGQDGGNGGAIITFTLTGDGGPTGAHDGGYYPSTAYGRLTSTSNGVSGSLINIADSGESPQDGFSEYQGFPGPTRPRWGDYGWAIFLPDSGGRIYFSTQYIQHRNCEGDDFDPTAIGTCDGTRDGRANWGTSVNYVVP